MSYLSISPHPVARKYSQSTKRTLFSSLFILTSIVNVLNTSPNQPQSTSSICQCWNREAQYFQSPSREEVYRRMNQSFQGNAAQVARSVARVVDDTIENVTPSRIWTESHCTGVPRYHFTRHVKATLSTRAPQPASISSESSEYCWNVFGQRRMFDIRRPLHHNHHLRFDLLNFARSSSHSCCLGNRHDLERACNLESLPLVAYEVCFIPAGVLEADGNIWREVDTAYYNGFDYWRKSICDFNSKNGNSESEGRKQLLGPISTGARGYIDTRALAYGRCWILCVYIDCYLVE